ncbi:MAG: hypothetical protein AAF228_07610, partial [Pseudomonadota bacterium]
SAGGVADYYGYHNGVEPEQLLTSKNGQYQLSIDTSGDGEGRLTLYKYNETSGEHDIKIWRTTHHFSHHHGAFLSLGTNGDLTLFDGHSSAKWHTDTLNAAVERPFMLKVLDSGNVALYDHTQSGRALWMSKSGNDGIKFGNAENNRTFTDNSLDGPDDILRPGDSIFSEDGKYSLEMKYNGDVVINQIVHHKHHEGVWSTDTGGKAKNGWAQVESDGRFSVFNSDGERVYSTHTQSAGVNTDTISLKMQHTGNLVLEEADGTRLWETGKHHHHHIGIMARPATPDAGSAEYDKKILGVGEIMNIGDNLFSDDNRYRLVMAANRDLMLFDMETPDNPAQPKLLWSTDRAQGTIDDTNTGADADAYVELEASGNLVMKNSLGNILWQSNSAQLDDFGMPVLGDYTLEVQSASGHDKEAIAIKDENGFVVWHSEYGQYKHWEVHQKKNWFQRNFPHVADWEEEHFAVFDTTFGRLHNHAHEFLEDLSTVTGIDSKTLLSIVEEIAFDVALYALEYFMPFTTELLEMLMVMYGMMGLYEFLADADSVKDLIMNVEDAMIAEGGPLVDVLNVAFPNDTDTSTSSTDSTASSASGTGNQNYASSTSTPATAPASATYTPTTASASAASSTPTPATSTNTQSSTPTVAASTNTPSSANTNNGSSKNSSSSTSAPQSLEAFLSDHNNQKSEYIFQGEISLANFVPGLNVRNLSDRFGEAFQMRIGLTHPKRVERGDGKTYRTSDLNISFREETKIQGDFLPLPGLTETAYGVNSHKLTIPLYWDKDKNLGDHKDGFDTGKIRWKSTLAAQLKLSEDLKDLRKLSFQRAKTPKTTVDSTTPTANLPTPQGFLTRLQYETPNPLVQPILSRNLSDPEKEAVTTTLGNPRHREQMGSVIDDYFSRGGTINDFDPAYAAGQSNFPDADPATRGRLETSFRIIVPEYDRVRPSSPPNVPKNTTTFSEYLSSYAEAIGASIHKGASNLLDHVSPNVEVGIGAAISHTYHLSDMSDEDRAVTFIMQSIPYMLTGAAYAYTPQIARAFSRLFPMSQSTAVMAMNIVEDGLSYATDSALENLLDKESVDRTWSNYLWFTGTGTILKDNILEDETGNSFGSTAVNAFEEGKSSLKARFQHTIQLEGNDFFDG